MSPPSVLLLAAAVVAGNDAAAAPARLYRVDHRLEADADRRDPEVFHSAPDSLHLDAAGYGETCYWFRGRPVEPGRRYRLRFHYLLARNGHVTGFARVAQYGHGVYVTHVIDGGKIERELMTVGQWTAVVMDFTALPEACDVEIGFRVEGDVPIGEMWVDDCSLVIAGQPITIGP